MIGLSRLDAWPEEWADTQEETQGEDYDVTDTE